MENYKIAIFLTNIDRLLIFLLLSFFYFQFTFLGFYLNKKNILNGYLILPFSFIASSSLFGILNFFANLFNSEIKTIFIFFLFITFSLYIINFFYFFKDYLYLKSKFFNALKEKSIYVGLFLMILIFITFFGIPSFPDGDAAFHISKINYQLHNGFSFKSNFNPHINEFAYPLNSTHFILTIIAYLTKFSPYSVWSYSLVFYALIFLLSIFGFLYWLLDDKFKSLFLGVLIFILRENVSFTTHPYPNNQHLFLGFFFLISLYYFFQNQSLYSLIFFILSLLGFQFTHISQSSLLIIFFITSFLAFIFLSKILHKKKLFLIVKNLFFRKENLFLLLAVFPLIFHVLYVINNFDYHSKIIAINEETDPFIINLYSVYARFNLRGIIDYFFKDLINFDNSSELFFLKNNFIQFLILFLIIAFSLRYRNKKLLYFSFFILFSNLIIFNLGFISQKILPLWLMMRVDYYFNYLVFIAVFCLINFLFEKIISKKNLANSLFLFFLFFLVISFIPRLQNVRNYARNINIGYANCEFFWKQVNDRIKLNGIVYTYGCVYPQYYLDVLTLNTRYEMKEEIDIRGQLDQMIASKKPVVIKNLKNYVDYVVINSCTKSDFMIYRSLFDDKKSFFFDNSFCVFKI